MPIFQETVPKAQYDLLKQAYADISTRYDTLFEKYAQLRPTHAQPAKITLHPPKPDSAQAAFRAGEEAIRDPRLAVALQRLHAQHPEKPEAELLREAKKLLAIGLGKDDAPHFGAVPR